MVDLLKGVCVVTQISDLLRSDEPNVLVLPQPKEQSQPQCKGTFQRYECPKTTCRAVHYSQNPEQTCLRCKSEEEARRKEEARQ